MLTPPGHVIDWGLPGALVLGMLTALQPCPLTTNLAALALLSGWNSERRRLLLSGVLLVAGMCTLYSVLAFGLTLSAVRVTTTAAIVQELASLFLGPLMMFAGGLMTGLLRWSGRIPIRGVTDWFGGARLDVEIKAFVLGIVLAAAFCPVSAGIFFAVLVPLAIARGQSGMYAVAFDAGCSVQ